jgi:hypothetical protein
LISPSWKEALPSPPDEGYLCEAWMTSFERPEDELLVEYFLPSLLNTGPTLSQNIHERNLFFGELGSALQRLRSRITVISSISRGERSQQKYPWLWRYVDHFTVGSKVKEIQHAKLWAFHWKSKEGEMLELHISSTNLTSSALRNQLQAGWRVILPLERGASISKRQTWGALIPFLGSLGSSAGTVAASRIQRLIALLGRTECPDGVTIIASVPGKSSAAKQLAKFAPSEIHVFTPTIGEWNTRTLDAWCRDIGLGCAKNKIHLKWIPEDHPWASRSGWSLSSSSAETLVNEGIKFDCLPNEIGFMKHHGGDDLRWSHAKLYLFRCYRKWRLMVTSANWSASAWGAGHISPRNFELGVIFETKWKDFSDLVQPFNPPSTAPFCIDIVNDEEHNLKIEWAEARWDGRSIELHARTSNHTLPIAVKIKFHGGEERCIVLSKGMAVFQWIYSDRPPVSANFEQEDEVIQVDILDLRPPSEFAKTPLPEVDPDVEEDLRNAFLLQQYGGCSDPELVIGNMHIGGYLAASVPNSDYSVKAWIEIRAAFLVLDNWSEALKETEDESQQREQVLFDGKCLKDIFSRILNAGDKIILDEIDWRLREFS